MVRRTRMANLGSSQGEGDDMKYEYRVVYKREGTRPKNKQYCKLESAQRFMLLLGPTPWKAYGKEADAHVCCNGNHCSCEGLTYREQTENLRAKVPALEYAVLERREVGEYEEIIPEVEPCDSVLSVVN